MGTQEPQKQKYVNDWISIRTKKQELKKEHHLEITLLCFLTYVIKFMSTLDTSCLSEDIIGQ